MAVTRPGVIRPTPTGMMSTNPTGSVDNATMTMLRQVAAARQANMVRQTAAAAAARQQAANRQQSAARVQGGGGGNGGRSYSGAPAAGTTPSNFAGAMRSMNYSGPLSNQQAKFAGALAASQANRAGVDPGLARSIVGAALSGNISGAVPSVAGRVTSMITQSPFMGGIARGATNLAMNNPAAGWGDIGGAVGRQVAGPWGGIAGAAAGSLFGGAKPNATINNVANSVMGSLFAGTPLGQALGVASMFGINPANTLFGEPNAITDERMEGLFGGMMNNIDANSAHIHASEVVRKAEAVARAQAAADAAAKASQATNDSHVLGTRRDSSGGTAGYGAGHGQISGPSGARPGSGFSGMNSNGTSGSGGGGSSRVICTHFYKAGDMPREHWLADMQFTMKHCSETTQRGYHYWAIPYVKLMRKSKLAENIMRPIALTRAKELAHKMGKSDKGSWTGKLVRMVLEPISYAIGLVVEQKDYRTLYPEGK